jgi:arylsulfatase A-like enzyme
MATFSALTGQPLDPAAGPDSFNILPALLGEPLDKPCRDHLVEHGNALAIRKGPWKLIPPSGGAAGKKAKGGAAPVVQLYNLADDLGETKNVAAGHPEIVNELAALLAQVREKGSRRP